ncbi:hypothetical protein ACHAWF_013879 [Thalassiosira exigua]
MISREGVRSLVESRVQLCGQRRGVEVGRGEPAAEWRGGLARARSSLGSLDARRTTGDGRRAGGWESDPERASAIPDPRPRCEVSGTDGGRLGPTGACGERGGGANDATRPRHRLRRVDVKESSHRDRDPDPIAHHIVIVVFVLW